MENGYLENCKKVSCFAGDNMTVQDGYSKIGLKNGVAALGARRGRRMFVALKGNLETVRVSSTKMALSRKLGVSFRTLLRAYDRKDELGVFFVKSDEGIWGVREVIW